MSLVAVVSAALAVALLLAPRVGPRRPGVSGTAVRRLEELPFWISGGAAAAIGSALLLYADGTLLALGLILLGAGLGAGRLVALAHRRRSAARREERVLEICEALAAELRSGQPPARAVAHCAELWPEFAPVSGAARLGADVPAGLRDLAALPGAEGLGAVAAAWQVSQASGATLSTALTQVADTARKAQDTQRIVASELASAQATARLVALLPAVTLFMGAGIGDPWGFLLESPWGLACLAVGLLLILLGLTWIEHLAGAVLRR